MIISSFSAVLKNKNSSFSIDFGVTKVGYQNCQARFYRCFKGILWLRPGAPVADCL
nr:hypothetical protein [uncultured Campylobacter sp.]